MSLTAFRKKATFLLLVLTLSIIIFYAKPARVQAKTSKNYEQWMKICNDMLKNLNRYHFHYSNSGAGSTFAGTKKGARKCNCAKYVSWCLQKYGAIHSGNTFYVKANGSIVKDFNWTKKVKVIKNYKKCTSTKLQPGDVVCWAGSAHTNIYAGKNKSGKRLWYDGGKVATVSNSNGSRYVHTGRRALGYLNGEKISYIIRIKNLS